MSFIDKWKKKIYRTNNCFTRQPLRFIMCFFPCCLPWFQIPDQQIACLSPLKVMKYQHENLPIELNFIGKRNCVVFCLFQGSTVMLMTEQTAKVLPAASGILLNLRILPTLNSIVLPVSYSSVCANLIYISQNYFIKFSYVVCLFLKKTFRSKYKSRDDLLASLEK